MPDDAVSPLSPLTGVELVVPGLTLKPIPGTADVFLIIRKVRATTNTRTAGVMTPDADQATNPGKVTYEWTAEDVETPGSYDFEIKVVLADTTEIRFPRDSAAPYGTMLILRNLEV